MNYTKRKLSVIIPVFNVQEYLPKCIESVVNQTYTDIEVILINDGSTDGSGSICDFYAKKNSNIKVIHKGNGGLSSARNSGLNIASGDYVAFVDSDDWVDADMYKTLIELLESKQVDLVACGFKEVFSNRIIFKSDTGSVTYFDKAEAINSLVSVENSIRFEVWNKVFKRNLIGDLRFKERQIFEDVYFDRNIFLKVEKTIYIDKPFYNYLKIRDGNTNSHFNENKLIVFKEFNDFIADLKDNKLFDSSQRFAAFALDFSISLYWDAARLGASREIKAAIVKQHEKYHRATINNTYVQKTKSMLFLLSPNFYVNLLKLKSKFSFK